MKIKTKFICTLTFVLFLCTSIFAHSNTLYVRGKILHFLDNPDLTSPQKSYQFFNDGLLMVKDGKIENVGPWLNLKSHLPLDAKVVWYKDDLIVPGFIDTHIHYPQLDMIAANGGGHLLQWLNTYTFPFERKLKNPKYANDVAHFFIEELVRNGTTTAMIFAAGYPKAVDALFSAAEKKNMRIITGYLMADRNLPKYLLESPTLAEQETRASIKKWHKKPGTRLLYAIMVRFAPTTSPELFEKTRKLKQQYPDTYMHTHISENQQEVAWANKLFGTKNYLDIYDKYDLLGDKTILAHGIYLSDVEFKRMHDTKTSVAFCPTSNLFLGSGLFNLAKAEKNGVTVGLGTDVGAGTSFSLLQTLNEAYKVLQLQNQNLSAFEGFYLATLGGAKALNLADKLGNFKPGKEADFVVLNFKGATPLLKRRLSFAKDLQDKLFVLMMLGDDRSVVATYVNGQLVYQK